MPFLEGARRRYRIAGEVKRVVTGLLNMNSLQMGRGKVLEDAIDLDAQILRGGDGVRKAVHGVKVHVVEPGKKMSLGEGIEVGQIAHHSCCRIYLPTERYLDDVVVTMAVRVVAFAEGGIVFCG